MSGTGTPAESPASLAGRLLPYEGGRNFRDLGGYRGADGRQLRWRQLYRAGSMAGLTASDLDDLTARNIKAIIDLRSGVERTAEPNPWSDRPIYWCREYEGSFAELSKLMQSDLPSPEAARMAMLAGFRELPFEQAVSYSELFQRIAAGQIPIVFHCTAGKDRTGVAAALLLSAIGVPRETILADFALTNHAVDLRHTFRSGADAKLNPFADLDPEVVATILTAHPTYVAACLDAVDERCGSIERYLSTHLSIGPGQLEAIRGILLE